MSLAFCFSSGGLHFSNSSCSYETLFRVKILLQANIIFLSIYCSSTWTCKTLSSDCLMLKKSCKFKKSINKDKGSHSLRKIWKIKKKILKKRGKKKVKERAAAVYLFFLEFLDVSVYFTDLSVHLADGLEKLVFGGPARLIRREGGGYSLHLGVVGWFLTKK